ncbi:MAG: porin [Saprospiraceae bacterium]|nr:porin [Saprospiraceae bacterium]
MNTLFPSWGRTDSLLSGLLLCIFCFLLPASAFLQEFKTEAPKPEKKWYEIISLRGYAQVRYNRLLESNPKLKCEQCDRSWGENGGLFIRRARLVFSGNIHKNVSFYIQPDFASNASSTNLHFGQIRDAYFDVGVDTKNEFRFRIGQSKVPYGFENLQSSQNRLTLDRNDALNSAVSNERDLGIFFYYAPESKRALFARLVKDGLKGSGDYGVFAFGAYNGQTANRPELNDKPHVVARISYPMEIGNQIIEPGIQAYTGQWKMAGDQISNGVRINGDRLYEDRRAAASFILYPKPLGFAAEYNIGRGPRYDKQTDSISVSSLRGGYFLVSYKIDGAQRTVIPFLKYQYYNGGKKHELDARSYIVKEVETGIEMQFSKAFEMVMVYTWSSRLFEDHILRNNLQKGRLIRIQTQVNF